MKKKEKIQKFGTDFLAMDFTTSYTAETKSFSVMQM